MTMTTDELLKIQSEIKALSDEFDAYRADWLGAKVKFVKLVKGFSPNVAASSHIEIPQAKASAQPTEEHASTADEIPAAEENEAPGLMQFQPLKKMSGQPLVLCLKN